jgi:formamidopyrimidine-DNA glycosylase
MPELPDIALYLDSLIPRVLNQPLIHILIKSPFLLRSVDPPPAELEGKRVLELRRMGKRIVLGFESDLFMAIHLMIAGRLHWQALGSKTGGRHVLAVLEFPHGMLVLTEAGSKRRASIHLVRGEAGLEQFQRGGLEVLEIDLAAFTERLLSENHTLKRALTDPRLFSGIGNAYSDEILHRAMLSPIALTQKLKSPEIDRLFSATKSSLVEWVELLRAERKGAFPEKVTAFRPAMAVHGKYGEPCPRCGAKIQRIRYASNETNYCATCQTGGRLLADRALSRLLGSDWPRTLEELESLKTARIAPQENL